MRKASWSTLAPGFERYTHTEAVGRFVERAARELQPLALILYGSLARGDYHQYSDADVCAILADLPADRDPLRQFFVGYERVVACDPSGVVQPVVYSPAVFIEMVRTANGLALEVLADGVFLAGDDELYAEIEALAARTRQQLGIERTRHGWRLTHGAPPGGSLC